VAYATTTACAPASPASTTTAAARVPTTSAFSTANTLAATRSSLSFLGSSLRLTCELYRDFATQDFFTGELGDGTLSFFRVGKINEGIAHGAGGARVGWD
jgi:hypothetical protein